MKGRSRISRSRSRDDQPKDGNGRHEDPEDDASGRWPHLGREGRRQAHRGVIGGNVVSIGRSDVRWVLSLWSTPPEVLVGDAYRQGG